MHPMIHTFAGRKTELAQWAELLADPAAEGKAVVVVGKYGMGKTWLLEQMIRSAKESKDLLCFAARYVIAPGESPGMVLRVILDDMFQAARCEAGSLNTEGKRFVQWLDMYRKLGVFTHRTGSDFRFLEQLRFDRQKNIFEQFVRRLQFFSSLLPPHGRLVFAIDPELDTLAARVELWTQVVKKLPPKVMFLFAQRYKDTLTVNEEFRSQKNVCFIPSQALQVQGLADLQDSETEQLIDAYQPLYKERQKNVDRSVLADRFRKYRNHPYAVHAALDLMLSPGFTEAEQLPEEPMPAAVCPMQWKGITEHPVHREAASLFMAYAVLEVPTLDEMVCWVADITTPKFQQILADPFFASMIRSEADGRLLYHHHLTAYIRSLLYTPDGTLTPEAMVLHQRAMTGYDEWMQRSLKPDPLATVRLAEHSLAVGGPILFAGALKKNKESFLTLGFYQTYAALIDRALALVSPLSVEYADLHYQMGDLRSRQGDFQTAMRHYEASLQTSRKLGEPERIATALFGLGKLSLSHQRLVEADMWLRDAIAYFETNNNQAELVEVYICAAEVQWLQGRTRDANDILDAARDIIKGIRNNRHQAKLMSAVYSAWGKMYEQDGDVDRSAEMYNRAIDLTASIYDQEQEAELRASLGGVFERIGNLISAEKNLSRALAIHSDLKNLGDWANVHLRLARVAELQGKPQQKAFHIEQAKAMYEQLGNEDKLKELS
jgi:tetratricopeptide (TPR) repeat protein